MAINFNNQNQYGLQIPNQNGIMDMAFKPGSVLDKQINKLNTLEQMGFPQPNLQKLKDMDMEQFQEEGTPLSLPEDQYAMAISNYDQLFGPRTMTDALYTGMIDQSGTPINYTDRIRQQNLPGFAYQPKESLRNIIGSQLQNAKTRAGQGFDFAKQIPNMLFSAATGIPFAGQIAQGIGGLLGSIFKESPEQKNFRENIATDPEYQNLVNSIPGMSNYNQIFGMGSGRGLMGAIDKRLATLARTEKRQGVNFSDTLKERRKKLEALREIERQKESEFLESQRRGRRPGTGGDGGGGTQDSGGPTGGYSYDSGGRQGFGYGLKDGGLASMFTRRG